MLIELAANALDAAREAGVPGRIRFTLHAGVGAAELRAANVGAPLSSAGVSALASLRASAKRGRDATVGHFGVGFTAVLAVTDAPQVISRNGGVRFSKAATSTAITALRVAELDAEVAARAGSVPTLRLPWPIETAVLESDPVPDGFETEVRLPLRDGLGTVLPDLLRSVGDDLLWALPGLQTVEIDLGAGDLRVLRRENSQDGITVLQDGSSVTRFRAATRSGTIPAALLVDRPTEERGRNQWQLTWVLAEPDEAPEEGFGLDRLPAGVFLGAPTPTDEPLSLPARLVGTFPVDDTRRRLAPGSLTEYLLGEAAAEYVDLVTAVPAERRFLLVPTAGFPLGPVDAALREAILRRLSQAPIAVTALDEPVAPSAACVINRIPRAAATLLARAVPGLLPPPRSPRELDATRVLGVQTIPLADATTALAGIDGPPSFWYEVYSALSDQAGEDLANLPVPLSGGGRRIGPAGCLLPGPDSIDVGVLQLATRLAPELRLIHPAAAHPLLARLGAVPADADALSTDPALLQLFRDFREDLEDSEPDPDDLRELAGLALTLAAESTTTAGLFEAVVLTDAAGEAWPASELLVPGAALAAVLAPDADLPMLGAEWLSYPQRALSRVGVRSGLTIVAVRDSDADLPDLRQWWSEVVGDGLPPEAFEAIADLDLVDDGKWPELLAMIAADPAALRTLTSGPEPSYTRWWLARSVLLAGHPPNSWRLPGAFALTGLYEQLPTSIGDTDAPAPSIHPAVARAIGVLSNGMQAVDSDPSGLLMRWGDPDRTVPVGLVPSQTALAAEALARNPKIGLPAAVRTLSGAVVDADDAMVLDLPWFAQVVGLEMLVAGGADPLRTARMFDLDLVSDSLEVRLVAADVSILTSDQQHAAERAALGLGLEFGELFRPGALCSTADLRVHVGSGAGVRVSWWPAAGVTDGSGGPADAALLTDGSAEGLGRAVAWRAGGWAEREIAVAAARGEPITFVENGVGSSHVLVQRHLLGGLVPSAGRAALPQVDR